MVTYPADTVDINGKVWKTIGENIRYGSKMQGGQPEPQPQPETDYHGLKIVKVDVAKLGSFSVIVGTDGYSAELNSNYVRGTAKTVGVLGVTYNTVSPAPMWWELSFLSGVVGITFNRNISQYTDFNCSIYFIEKE